MTAYVFKAHKVWRETGCTSEGEEKKGLLDYALEHQVNQGLVFNARKTRAQNMSQVTLNVSWMIAKEGCIGLSMNSWCWMFVFLADNAVGPDNEYREMFKSDEGGVAWCKSGVIVPVYESSCRDPLKVGYRTLSSLVGPHFGKPTEVTHGGQDSPY